MKKALAIVSSMIFLFSGCKKYPEDKGFIHLSRPQARIWKHPLQIDEYKVNDEDSIPYVNSKLFGGYTLSNIDIQL
jgi:hypothetical protein